MQVFNYEEKEIRTIMIDGVPWWVLKDVCEVVELSNARMVADRLDEDEVRKLDLRGRTGEVHIINESGLYSVILRSDKPNAKNFRKWITSVVLLGIRTHGAYIVDNPPEQATTYLLNQTINKAVDRVMDRLATLGVLDQGRGIAALLEQKEPYREQAITAADIAEMDQWESILCEWRRFRAGYKSMEQGDSDFIAVYNAKNPEKTLSKRTLWRKWKKYKTEGKIGLMDFRGKHSNHRRKYVVDTEVVE